MWKYQWLHRTSPTYRFCIRTWGFPPHLGPSPHLLNPALDVHECVTQAVLPLRQCSLLHCANISFSMHAIAQPCRHQRRNEGGEGGRNSPGAESLWGRQITAEGAEWLRGVPKSPNNITSTFFNTVHLLPKDLRSVAILEWKTWGGHCGSKEKLGGAT